MLFPSANVCFLSRLVITRLTARIFVCPGEEGARVSGMVVKRVRGSSFELSSSWIYEAHQVQIEVLGRMLLRLLAIPMTVTFAMVSVVMTLVSTLVSALLLLTSATVVVLVVVVAVVVGLATGLEELPRWFP